MEKIDLIQTRSFGERLNEMTALIYDNFFPFLRKSWWLILCAGVILTVIMEYFPTETPIEGWSSFLLEAFIVALLVILFVALIRLVGIEQKPVQGYRDFFVHALFWGGRALTSMLLPFALLCLFGGYFVSLITSFDVQNIVGLFFLRLLLCLVIIMASAPLFQIINVCVLEEKSGFTALNRAFRIVRYRLVPSLFFYFMIIFLSLLIPTVVELPYMIFNLVRDIVTDEYGFAADPSIGDQIVNFIFNTLGTCAFIIYICIASLATLLQYGHAVEVLDNVHFLEKFNNFDNL